MAPVNRKRFHRFAFHIDYGYDVGCEEEFLIVLHCTYYPVFAG